MHYSLQRDHIHLIVEADDAKALGRGMMSVGCRLARTFNRVFRRKGRVLGDRYHVRSMKTPREVRNALAYVLLNASKHLESTGRLRDAARVGIDPASSGRWFDGWKDHAGDAPLDGAGKCVASAKSWLLRSGWRRRGLILSTEVPGTPRVGRHET